MPDRGNFFYFFAQGCKNGILSTKPGYLMKVLIDGNSIDEKALLINQEHP